MNHRALRFLAFLVAAGVAPATGVEATRLEEHVEIRLVRVPVTLTERTSGGCDGLDAESIEVLEDGMPVVARHLEPTRLHAAHAILVDTGPGMLDKLGEARRAALAYVTALPSEEPALLATFDHRLMLHAPLSTDRERLERSVAWIEPGASSNLWESTRQLIRDLGSRSERKVVILVTRGCDTQGLRPTDPLEVIDLAVRTPSLIVFSIGLDMPARCEGTAEDPAVALRELAKKTGGRHYFLDSVAELGPIFRAVRETLDREAHVIYAPRPFGAGPKDPPGKPMRLRKLRVRLRGKVPCRVTVSGPASRCESAPGADGCVLDRTAGLALTEPFRLDSDQRLRAEIRDIVKDLGPVAPPLSLGPRQSPPPGRPRAVARARSVESWIPPADALIRPGARPEDVVIHALSRVSRFGAGASGQPAADGPRNWTEVPFLVNGRTLLDVRRSLSLALADHPDYLAWAVGRIGEERLSDLESFADRAGDSIDGQLVERARLTLRGGGWAPEPRELEMRLGAWLGDIPVARVFRAAEAWLAGHLLTGVEHGGVEGLPDAWDEVQRLWTTLAVWLPAPRDVRLLGWLVPGYDPRTDAVGYYRVVLAAPYSSDLLDLIYGGGLVDATRSSTRDTLDPSLIAHLRSFNYSRKRPLGARLVRWMLEQPEVVGPLTQRFEVLAVEYPGSETRDLAPALKRGGLESLLPDGKQTASLAAREVTLLLGERGTAGATLPVGAYFLSRGLPGKPVEEPFCLVISRDGDATPAGRQLLGALLASKWSSGSPCVLD